MLKNNVMAVRCLNSPLKEVVAVRAGVKDGFLYGLELELEGRGVGMEGEPSKNWRRVEDGSLRGESIEYVFAQPCEYDEAVKRVDALFKALAKNKVKLKNSYRTSTHVHLNFGDKIGKHIVNFFLLHTIFEEILEYFCGDMRKGNLFCLSARDTENLISMLEDSIFLHGNYALFNVEVRYNAANLAALNKFGTIELRTMRGANNPEEVKDWLEILKHLYEFACSDACPPPHKLAESLSHLGPDGFMRQVFPQRIIDKLLATFPVVRDVRQSLLDGVRLIQMLAYKLEEPWLEEYKNPFDGAAKKGAKGKVDLDLVAKHRNQIRKPNGEAWFVRIDYEHRDLVDDDNTLQFDAINNVFKHVRTGDRCEWLMYQGNHLVPGTAQYRKMNWWIEEEDDDDEELDDWEIDNDD